VYGYISLFKRLRYKASKLNLRKSYPELRFSKAGLFTTSSRRVQKTYPTAVKTAAGGTSRPAFRIPAVFVLARNLPKQPATAIALIAALVPCGFLATKPLSARSLAMNHLSSRIAVQARNVV